MLARFAEGVVRRPRAVARLTSQKNKNQIICRFASDAPRVKASSHDEYSERKQNEFRDDGGAHGSTVKTNSKQHMETAAQQPSSFGMQWGGGVSAMTPSGLYDILDKFGELLEKDQKWFDSDGRCGDEFTTDQINAKQFETWGSISQRTAFNNIQFQVCRGLSMLPICDIFEREHFDSIWNRMLDKKLLDRFSIPAFDHNKEKRHDSLHWKKGPEKNAYGTMRIRSAYLGLHPWLINFRLHNAGYEGRNRSTRVYRQYNSMLLDLMLEANIPSMQQNEELSHFIEFVYGMYQQLDEVVHAQDKKKYPVAASIKYVLWANVYCGAIPYEAPELQELTVYVMRNLKLMQNLDAAAVLTGDFSWADLPPRP